jgi:hypothetical protein
MQSMARSFWHPVSKWQSVVGGSIIFYRYGETIAQVGLTQAGCAILRPAGARHVRGVILLHEQRCA